MDEKVRVETLDWGGAGRPVVLLAGGGDTAHVFDDFAPKLTEAFHVYGMTRRGFGESSFSSTPADADRLADDVVAVLDALELKHPVLVGHSIAGREMSSIANRHKGRVAGLVYLEAGYPYAFDNGAVPMLNAFQDVRGPQPPPPTELDRASFDALGQYYRRVLGFAFPEAELRQQWSADAHGRVARRRDFPGAATLLAGMRKYDDIPVSALLLYGLPRGRGQWVDDSPDPDVTASARAYSAAMTALTERQVEAIADAVPTARVVRVPGAHHYIFLSHEADVLRETRAFLTQLDTSAVGSAR